jgi:hypothetical protein
MTAQEMFGTRIYCPVCDKVRIPENQERKSFPELHPRHLSHDCITGKCPGCGTLLLKAVPKDIRPIASTN